MMTQLELRSELADDKFGHYSQSPTLEKGLIGQKARNGLRSPGVVVMKE